MSKWLVFYYECDCRLAVKLIYSIVVDITLLLIHRFNKCFLIDFEIYLFLLDSLV